MSQRKQPEIALLQLGAGIDIGSIPLALVTPESVEIILAEYPRLGFKAAMLAAMGAVVRRKPNTGALNLMGEIGREREHLPIPGFCDVVTHAGSTSRPTLQVRLPLRPFRQGRSHSTLQTGKP